MDVERTKACGRCLASLRRGAGVTQVELALSLGVPQSFVSKIETGERALKVYEQFDYCHALGISPHDFIDCLEAALRASAD